MRTMDRVTSVSTGTGQSRLELESKKPDGLDRAVVARGALLGPRKLLYMVVRDIGDLRVQNQP